MPSEYEWWECQIPDRHIAYLRYIVEGARDLKAGQEGSLAAMKTQPLEAKDVVNVVTCMMQPLASVPVVTDHRQCKRSWEKRGVWGEMVLEQCGKFLPRKERSQ